MAVTSESSISPTSPTQQSLLPNVETHLTDLLRKIKSIYPGILKSTLGELYAIVLKCKHDSLPLTDVYKNIDQLLGLSQPELAEFFKKEVSQFIPSVQDKVPKSPRSNKDKTNTKAKNNSNGTIIDKNNLTSTDNGETRTSKEGMEPFIGEYTISYVRSQRPSPVRRSTTHRTLEGDSIQQLLQKGKPSLIDDIYQHIDHADTFTSFLELLSLYDSQTINYDELMQRAVPFLGSNKALLERFNQGILEDRLDTDQAHNDDDLLEYPPSSLRTTCNNEGDSPAISVASSSTTNSSSSSPLYQFKDNTSSYRWIPKSRRSEQCSGRDKLCWQVLNDEYVSHPTWASEDNGFLSSKKNKYEDMIHRVEDERYGLDIEICNNWDVLTHLEKYLRRLKRPSQSLKGKSKSTTNQSDVCSSNIVTQAVKKLYTRDRQQDIMESIRNNPIKTLPDILKLMKQRDVDLRKQKAEKEESWNETVDKNYYKSLDYHKTEGRKNLTIQSLVTEIDALWHEQQRLSLLDKQRNRSQLALLQQQQQEEEEKTVREENGNVPSSTSTPSSHRSSDLSPPQLVYTMHDSSIAYDIFELMRTSNRHQIQYSNKDASSIDYFITHQLPQIFGLPENIDIAIEHDPSTATSTEKSKIDAIQTRSQRQRQQLRQEHTPSNLTDNKVHRQITVNFDGRLFIGNTNWYCVIRYFQMIYECLSILKTWGVRYKESPEDTKRSITAAVDLKLDTKGIASVEIDLKQGYYQAAIDIIKHFITGNIEQLDFEEGIRYFFGVQAYVTFNFEKTMLALIRQVHQIVNNSKCMELFTLFQTIPPTIRLEDIDPIALYRHAVEDIIGSTENKFIISMDGAHQQLCLQILGMNEAVFPHEQDDDYHAYLTTYQNRKKKTLGVKRKRTSKVFLKRNLEDEQKRAKSNIMVQQDLRYKICKQAYHMFYETGTEDMYVRQLRKPRRSK
ncbi:Sin3 family co-repressor-domain-containing protein [Halteromyces radiatus]|uniref:Sin3 family co-repressor-domain-containing protein n=1 Tax=Halteromyces radiatus TaxID=101107 RepID=UPI00221F89EA|nr:Sin3 family co-repressor-domain-containing protein [Halteromyces radiatus]KAI8081409.1 Sin3 family co-repressor-domain-containing protein [Halteromyces radiatus]